MLNATIILEIEWLATKIVKRALLDKVPMTTATQRLLKEYQVQPSPEVRLFMAKSILAEMKFLARKKKINWKGEDALMRRTVAYLKKVSR